MKKHKDGKAIVYCEKAFNTPYGKTAHGLVRFTERYDILAVIDSVYARQDAGEVLDGRKSGIPVFASFQNAYDHFMDSDIRPTHFIIGLATDGGRLPLEAKSVVREALKIGMNVDSGLHDFLTNDKEMVNLAIQSNVSIRDIRKTPNRDKLHFFTGEIENVNCLKIAILGTDSAIGKRTTSWLIVHGLQSAGYACEMIGTGQTSWMQGAKYSMIMDSCINDFVSGEIEHAVVCAWKNEHPDFIILEGQGSLMNPAYPGGFEILAAGRPDYVILQHAPKRFEYDGFPGYRLHTLDEQINAIKAISGKEVIAITLNHELMTDDEILPTCELITRESGIPCFDVLKYGVEDLIKLLITKLPK